MAPRRKRGAKEPGAIAKLPEAIRILRDLYIESVEPLSIRELAARPEAHDANGKRIRGTTEKNLQHHCTRGNWVLARETYWKAVTDKAQAKSIKKAADILAEQDDIYETLQNAGARSVLEYMDSRAKQNEKLAEEGKDPLPPMPVEMALATLFRAMKGRRDILEMVEADLTDDDGLLEIEAEVIEDLAVIDEETSN